ncbi:DUF1349 domain-containing protein [Streptomyces roseolus]|uniref:DUF1349 domain-containing protein n=1 Tax=Streptomyces roseolus TaxID=67358 RepID=UPI00378D9B72
MTASSATWDPVVGTTVGPGGGKRMEASAPVYVTGTREEALAGPERRARASVPGRPRSPRRRRLLRQTDGFPLLVGGAWPSYVTRFTAAEPVEDSTAPEAKPPVERFDAGVPVRPARPGRPAPGRARGGSPHDRSAWTSARMVGSSGGGTAPGAAGRDHGGMNPVTPPSLPLPLGLAWATPPASWSLDGDVLTVTAAARTDLFTDPLDGTRRQDAALALTAPPDGDWQLSARLRVGFAGAWDAGALVVHADDEHWAKLTFERAPDGTDGVFSVVTRGRSDDAVAAPVTVDALWLRISRTGDRFAFHSSEDGARWRLVRQFALGTDRPVRVGVVAQSPVGDGCRTAFDRLRLTPTTLAHLFDGR